MSADATFDKIQLLNDVEFHLLCDAVLSVTESRYRLLTPRGRNLQGQSVRGQPDSYIGVSPELCSIAFQYSTQKQGWASKAVQDITDAKATCLDAVEFVFATPVDIDRDGPSSRRSSWIAEAKAVIGSAKLSPFGGRTIAQFLNTHRQDLRYSHLGIPCSRLSLEAILVRCNEFNSEAVQRLIDQGRYVPREYVLRNADAVLFELWHRCVNSERSSSSFKLLPLVGDSGIGKTSLMARFTETTMDLWPVILVQARDVMFGEADSLVRHVIQIVEGVLSEAVRRTEEAALSRTLGGNRHFTVILDGLDEANDTSNVRKAINTWLISELAERSTLITTSRPEFWQRCIDPSWKRHIVDASIINLIEPKSPRNNGKAHSRQAISIASPFTDWELTQAWSKAGFDGHPFSFQHTLREELRHPFNFHVAAELLRANVPLPILRTKTDLIDHWVNERLRLESVRHGSRISPGLLRKALLGLAEQAQNAPGGWLKVDELVGIPRFDATNPPGPIVEGLLHANLLESRGTSGDEIRFTFEALQDFFLAERDASQLHASTLTAVVEQLVHGTFTDFEWRLERLGRQLTSHPLRDTFASMLIERDLWKGAALLRGQPEAFAPIVRLELIKLLCKELHSSISYRRAKAAEMLAWFNGSEVNSLISGALLTDDQYNDFEIAIIAETTIRLSLLDCVQIVPKCRWFRRGQYYSDVRSLLGSTSSEFRRKLSDLCVMQLNVETRDTYEHIAYVNILGYLHDDRVMHHLERLLVETNNLTWNETATLIELGTKQAAAIYFRFVSCLAATGRTVHEMLNVEPKDHRIWSATGLEIRACRKYLSREFEEHVVGLLDSSNDIEWTVSNKLVERFPSKSLLEAVFSRRLKRSSRHFGTRIGDVAGRAVDLETWKQFWDHFPFADIRKELLHAARHLKDPRVEAILCEALETPELLDVAADTLAHLGCFRAAPAIRDILRRLLANKSDEQLRFVSIHNLVAALGNLRDPMSVQLLSEVARTNDEFSVEDALISIAEIRSNEAGQALADIANTFSSHRAIAALIYHGQTEWVENAVEIARLHSDTPQWLIENALPGIFFFRGCAIGKYHLHIDTGPIIDFIENRFELLGPDNLSKLLHWFDNVDGEPVRRLLRRIAKLENTAFDNAKSFHSVAIRMLAERGDDSVVLLAAEQIMNNSWFDRKFIEDDLVNFTPSVLVSELKNCLFKTTMPDSIKRLLRQIGRLGNASDAEAVRSWTSVEDTSIASIACEALARLIDPRLLPHIWR